MLQGTVQRQFEHIEDHISDGKLGVGIMEGDRSQDIRTESFVWRKFRKSDDLLPHTISTSTVLAGEIELSSDRIETLGVSGHLDFLAHVSGVPHRPTGWGQSCEGSHHTDEQWMLSGDGDSSPAYRQFRVLLLHLHLQLWLWTQGGGRAGGRSRDGGLATGVLALA